MKQYLELLQELQNAVVKDNRTGISTSSKFHHHMKFDLSTERFPAITTKPLAFRSVMGELLGFIRGTTNAKTFRDLSCNVWNDNANNHGHDLHGNVVTNKWLSSPFRKGQDDLGRIYGAQWRDWDHTYYVNLNAPQFKLINHLRESGYVHMGDLVSSGVGVYRKKVDQLANAIHELINNPLNRRIIISAWNPGDIDKMALPPCHVLMHWQCEPVDDNYKLNLLMYQRSADSVLGIPFNIASYSALMMIMCRITGHAPGTFHYVTGDTHIYTNHADAVTEQLARIPIECNTKLAIAPHLKTLQDFELAGPDDFYLYDYLHHGKLSSETPMAI